MPYQLQLAVGFRKESQVISHNLHSLPFVMIHCACRLDVTKILYNATHQAHLWAKRDLTPPGTFSQTESLNQVLPPRSSPLLLPEVVQMLLSLVHQQPQVPLVDLVLPSSRLDKLCQRSDLRRQDCHLHLRATSIWARTLLLLYHGSWVSTCGLGCKYIVGVVATESIDATLGVDAETVLRAGQRQGCNALHGLLGTRLFLCDYGPALIFREFSSDCVGVGVLQFFLGGRKQPAATFNALVQLFL